MSSISAFANTSLASTLQDIQQKFKTADTSGNGTLSQAELTAAAKNTETTLKDADLATAFKKLDADGNGELTQDEITDGIELAEQVQQALLVAQEITSGNMLLSMLGGSTASSGSNLSSMFSSGAEDTSGDTGSTLASIIANTYKATEDAVTEEAAKSTTTA